jgi:hypothetical protein
MGAIPPQNRFGTHVHDQEAWLSYPQVGPFSNESVAIHNISQSPGSRTMHGPRDTPKIVFSKRLAAGSLRCDDFENRSG